MPLLVAGAVRWNEWNEHSKHAPSMTPGACSNPTLLAQEATAKIDEYARGMISGSGSTLFEELGLYYIGPVDGHNLDTIISILQGARATLNLALRGSPGLRTRMPASGAGQWRAVLVYGAFAQTERSPIEFFYSAAPRVLVSAMQCMCGRAQGRTSTVQV